MSKHMFAGANTPEGFCNNFEHILPFDTAQKTICLKGGSGTGKSTFMKKTANFFKEKGHTVEYIHCSNDAESLDAVVIKDLGISVLDGTAPHVRDPIAPIAIDKILNFADFIDESSIKKHKEELRGLLQQKNQFFDKGYNYLNAAYKVYLNNSYIYNMSLSRAKLNKKILELTDIFKFAAPKEKQAKNRKLFASAISPDGLKNYINTVIDTKNVYILEGHNGTGTDILLSKIQSEANLRGLDTESFYCSLNPNKPEHLIIPKLDTSFVTSNSYHKIELQNAQTINFNHFTDNNLLSSFEEELKYNYKIFDELLQKAMDTMAASKTIHDKIEKIYIAAMDFTKLDEIFESTVSYLCD